MERNKYSFQKERENSASLVFHKENEEKDLQTIQKAVALAYKNKVVVTICEDDFGKVGITFMGQKESIKKIANYYQK